MVFLYKLLEKDPCYLDLIQAGYFEFIKSRTDMTFVVLDMNNIDFIACKDDLTFSSSG